MGQPDTWTLPDFLLKAPQKQTSHRRTRFKNKREYFAAYRMICSSNWASVDSECFQWKDALKRWSIPHLIYFGAAHCRRKQMTTVAELVFYSCSRFIAVSIWSCWRMVTVPGHWEQRVFLDNTDVWWLSHQTLANCRGIWFLLCFLAFCLSHLCRCMGAAVWSVSQLFSYWENRNVLDPMKEGHYKRASLFPPELLFSGFTMYNDY